jgi:hypothetical protein
MTEPRKLNPHQRAAHLVLPLVAELIKELDDEAKHVEAEARRPKKSHDAGSDWVEMALKARAKVDGASRVAGMLQRLARG